MKWFLGIDGGGSKTTFLLGNEKGEQTCSITSSGCSWQSIGVEAVVALLKAGAEEILQKNGLLPKDCQGCCIGLPCFGENAAIDTQLKKC